MQVISKKPITEEEKQLIENRLIELYKSGLTKRQARRKVVREFSIKFVKPKKQNKLPKNCNPETINVTPCSKQQN